MFTARSSFALLAALSFSTGVQAQDSDGDKLVKSDAAPAVVKVSDAKPSEAAEKPPGDGKGLEAAKPAAVVKPEPTLVAKIDLSGQRMTVLVNGQATYTWPVSSGRQGYATPVGSFTPGWKAKMWYSKQYDDAPMPHSVFFKNGAAIHATQAVGMLGRPASHGCVRLSPANAATFYGLVGKHGLSQTRVVVFGTPKHAPAIAERGPSKQPAAAQRVAGQPRAIYAAAPQRYPQYVQAAPGGFNNGGSWFGSSGYAYGQPQPVRYIPRGYRAY